MAIQQLYKTMILDAMKTMGVKAQVTIDGVTKEYPLSHTTQTDSTLKHFVYLENETGTITSAKLIDSVGRDLQTLTTSIQKGPDGLAVVFAITVNIKEAY